MSSKYCKFYFLICSIAMLSETVYSRNRIPSFETTRMKSTAGAGVASILMDEATYLNPATIAYYNQGGVLYQKAGIETTQSDSANTEEFKSTSIIASDAKGLLGGSLSYNSIIYQGQEVKQFSSAFGRPIGKKSSFGVRYSHNVEETFNAANRLEKQKFNFLNFGIAHVIDENLSLGFILEDAFNERPGTGRVLTGLQYVYGDFVSLMFDLGTDYRQNLSNSLLWKVGTQLRVFDDFFLRFGTFRDKGKAEKGSGAGIGWLQPRLVIELAVKNLDYLENLELNQSSEQIKETSFSLSYRF